MNDHSTGDKLALQKRGEQTNAGAAKYSESIANGLEWAKWALPVGTYNDLAKQVYATLLSRDPDRYEQAARAFSEMMDKSARQQKAFHDATEGSKVFLPEWGDPEKAAEYVRQLRAANAAKAQAEAEKKAKAEAIAKANADAKAAGGTQGVQGAQAGVKTGNAVVGGGVQGSNNKPGKKSGMSDAEINAFLNEELGGNTTDNGTYASADVPKGGTKTIGYDPNPGNVSLAYAMRNAPEQERRNALIDKWNLEHGRTGSTGYATGQGMLTSGSNGTYATGEGIKDANGNVLTNPGGDWEYQYALRDPQYGLGMMGKMSDAQKKYLQAVADDMGYNYNFTGAPRFV